jgi:hypothetical protein
MHARHAEPAARRGKELRMPFTSQQMEKAKQWLQSHTAEPCPMCRARPRSFVIQPGVFTALAVQDEAPRMGSGATVVAAMCANCAYVMFFGAQAMGVYPPTWSALRPRAAGETTDSRTVNRWKRRPGGEQ